MDIDNAKIDSRIRVKAHWTKTKEEIWATHFESLTDDNIAPAQKFRLSLRLKRVAVYASVAAVLAFALTLPFGAYMHSEEYIAQPGQHLFITLPDNSTAYLNADSKLSYKPYWWFFSREVKLEGEGFFQVEKGEKFKVLSDNATVTVLGTSFNVLDRDEKLEVLCITGKVKVDTKKNTATLEPNLECSLENGKLTLRESTSAKRKISWKDGYFYFENVPLKDVIKEIERQFDIKVSTPANLNYLYTGFFSKEKTPEEILNIIGTPFGITFQWSYNK